MATAASGSFFPGLPLPLPRSTTAATTLSPEDGADAEADGACSVPPAPAVPFVTAAAGGELRSAREASRPVSSTFSCIWSTNSLAVGMLDGDKRGFASVALSALSSSRPPAACWSRFPEASKSWRWSSALMRAWMRLSRLFTRASGRGSGSGGRNVRKKINRCGREAPPDQRAREAYTDKSMKNDASGVEEEKGGGGSEQWILSSMLFVGRHVRNATRPQHAQTATVILSEVRAMATTVLCLRFVRGWLGLIGCTHPRRLKVKHYDCSSFFLAVVYRLYHHPNTIPNLSNNTERALGPHLLMTNMYSSLTQVRTYMEAYVAHVMYDALACMPCIPKIVCYRIMVQESIFVLIDILVV